MTEEAALLAAICAEPAEDTPRLAYADWLDEQGDGRVPCPRCKTYQGIDRVLGEHGYAPPMRECTFCDNTGTVVGTANSDRAEFIRVQVAMAQWDCGFKQTEEQAGWRHNCGTDDRGYWLCQPLRFRSDELLRQYADAWRPEVLREKDEPIGACNFGDGRGTVYPEPGFAVGVTYARGFIGGIICTARKWTADRERRADLGKCPDCPNCLWCGASRGSVFCMHGSGPLDCLAPLCPACSGTGRLTRGDGFAARVVLACPVAGVTLSDREPVQIGDVWNWMPGSTDEPEVESPHFVGPTLYKRLDLPFAMVGNETMNAKCADTADAAHQALSDACVGWARAEAGLSP